MKARIDEKKGNVRKGVERPERHPADGLPLKHDHKKGHGGKYTWEGPRKDFDPAPPAIDEKDPNYVDEEAKKIDGEIAEKIVGEVEVSKNAEEEIARIEIHPKLMIN